MIEKIKEEPIDLDINVESLVKDTDGATKVEYDILQEEKANAVKKWENKETKKSLVSDNDNPEDVRKSRECVNKEIQKDLYGAYPNTSNLMYAPEELDKKQDELKQIRKEIDTFKEYKEKLNKTKTFSGILKEMDELHTKKNTDYGNAWHEEMQEFGPICGVLRLYEKTKRLASLYKNGKAEVNDESFEDTLLDIANYAVMTLAEMRNK